MKDLSGDEIKKEEARPKKKRKEIPNGYAATPYVTSDKYQKFSPDGSNRTITLPDEPTNDGLEFVIIHGDGANTLTVKVVFARIW